MLGSVWDREQGPGSGGRDGEGGPHGAGEGCISGIKVTGGLEAHISDCDSLEARGFSRTGDKVKSWGSRVSLSRGKEATGGKWVAVDCCVKCLGGWWFFTASGLDT